MQDSPYAYVHDDVVFFISSPPIQLILLEIKLCIEYVRLIRGRIHVECRAKPLVQSRAVGLFATFSNKFE